VANAVAYCAAVKSFIAQTHNHSVFDLSVLLTELYPVAICAIGLIAKRIESCDKNKCDKIRLEV
jgi:hypothetical protein